MCLECNSSEEFFSVPLPPSINLKHLNFEREVDRPKIYEIWRVPFVDANQLAAAGFYFTNQSDIVRCVFCGVEIGYWTDGDDALKEHQRWSRSCGSVKGLYFGNIPILSNGQPDKIISTAYTKSRRVRT